VADFPYSPERQHRTQLIQRRQRVAGLLVILALVAVGFIVLQVTSDTDTHGASITHFTFASQAVDRSIKVSVVTPGDGGVPRPLLIFLHGRNESDSSYTDDEAFFAALSTLGVKAPIVAFSDGDKDSYWHNRRTGHWGDYVVDEVIPQVVKRFHVDPSRVAIGGISMGGFGAYDLALAHPGRFCAVGGHSPALWLRGADTAPGAFDDAADFTRNDVIARVRSNPNAFGQVRVWNDAGNQDPFLISDSAFAEALRGGRTPLTTVERGRGGHDRSYWDRHWKQYLRFYADALAHCRR
jgi:S-formylglutathione hydrolase FrmB